MIDRRGGGGPAGYTPPVTTARPLPTPARMSRREFLARSAVAASVASLAELRACTRSPEVRRPEAIAPVEGSERFGPAELAALEAAQDVLLPSGDGSPGARDVRATAYLDAALAEPGADPSERALIRGGLRRLDTFGGAPFATLDADARERALRSLEALDGGRRWVILVLTYTLEAYLGDPVHGGNPDGVAWQYLQTAPLFPRPGR